jgi:phage shock protein PspC (stress-responsive transcriptional regulator)
MDNSKKLYKTSDGAVFGGICKGFSEVYDTDVSVVRLVTLLLLLFAGVPLLVYIVMYFVIPNKDDVVTVKEPEDDYTVKDDEYYY